jgi:hypothetical protein
LIGLNENMASNSNMASNPNINMASINVGSNGN